jgi:hypothetical protein
VHDRLVVPGLKEAIVELYAPKVQTGHGPRLGHYPRTRVPWFYMQLSEDDLDTLLVPLAMEPVLAEKLKIGSCLK